MTVENTETAVAQTGVEDAGAGAPTAKEGVDLADVLAKTLDRLEKVERDRDNYRTGMLRAKGKLGDEDDEDETDEPKAKVDPTVAALIKSNEQLAQTIKEQSQAMLNRAPTGATGQGTSTEPIVKPGDNMLSEAQISALKAQGKDDAWIARFKQNLLKNR